MTPQNNFSTPGIVASEEPDVGSNDLPTRRPAAPETVEVRHRGRLATWLSMFSCCSKSSMTNSIHFHAHRVEDSVHVMIKHDKEAYKKRGQPEHGYKPRAPLSEQLAACHKLEVARQAKSGATIEAREDDGESDMDRDILAAITKADCGGR